MKVAVLGAGSWGTTLALILHSNDHKVTCWSFDENDIQDIITTHENKKFLPGVELPEDIIFTGNLQATVKDAEVIVVVVPSHAVRTVISEISDKVVESAIWVLRKKGWNQEKQGETIPRKHDGSCGRITGVFPVNAEG